MAPSKKLQIIKSRRDFLLSFKGRKVPGRSVSLYLRENGLKTHRLGITAPGKLGNAVVRNRLKRWCREIARQELNEIKTDSGTDFHFLISRPVDEFEEFRRTLVGLLKKAI
ncbi:MAG: ribonuclease P protein component [Oligoflexia bacterium]|nr:ribonuclease P protein component [Oligoflexia bacterium]